MGTKVILKMLQLASLFPDSCLILGNYQPRGSSVKLLMNSEVLWPEGNLTKRDAVDEEGEILQLSMFL